MIEVGLAYGSSALAIAEALVVAGSDHPRHIIIDAHQVDFHDMGWAALVDAGLDAICSLIRQPSQIALPRLLAEELVADAAFVDGSHLFHMVFVDLYYLQELIRPGGLVVVDDYDWAPVATAVRYFETNLGWCTEPIAAPTRLRAFRLPDPSSNRPSRHSGHSVSSHNPRDDARWARVEPRTCRSESAI